MMGPVIGPVHVEAARQPVSTGLQLGHDTHGSEDKRTVAMMFPDYFFYVAYLIFVVAWYLLYGIPIAVMYSRAGLPWAWSLIVLIPVLGTVVAMLILINREWRPRRTG